MESEVVWLLVFGIFVTVIFVVGVYYTISEFDILKGQEPEQRKEHEDREGTKINDTGRGGRRET